MEHNLSLLASDVVFSTILTLPRNRRMKYFYPYFHIIDFLVLVSMEVLFCCSVLFLSDALLLRITILYIDKTARVLRIVITPTTVSVSPQRRRVSLQQTLRWYKI